jgi:tetratricopeptide (TPR) repeat protein
MKKISIQLLCCLIFIGLMDCDTKVRDENVQLKVKNAELQNEVDSLKAIISTLQQTDNYYYQMAVNSRQNKDYDKSNKFLRGLIERFPQSEFIGKTNALIIINSNDIAQDIFERALSAQKLERFEESNELLKQLLADYPKSNFADKSKRVIAENQKQIKEKEEAAEKQGSDLELTTWSWSTTAGGSYVVAKGQVKNISDQSLRNVEAVVSYYDRNENFITSSSALIDFNPILAGQTSPFSTMETYNPAMRTASIQFKYLMGGTIPTYNKKK